MKSLIKITPLLLFALLIDGLQALVAASLTLMTMAAGGAAPILGAGVGGVILGVIGVAVGGITCVFTLGGGCVVAAGAAGLAAAGAGAAAGSVAGTAAGVAIQPIGIGLGFVASVCISITLGSMLVFFLFFLGMLDKKAAVLTYMGEAIPGFGILPAWTALVIRCAFTSYKEAATSKVIVGAAAIGSNFVLPDNEIGEAMQEGTRVGLANAVALARTSIPMRDIRTRPQNNRDTIDSDRYAEAA